jgi:hypothetical protein
VESLRKQLARCWWLIPVILATQQAEVRRMEVQSQPQARKTHHETELVEWLRW